VLRQLVSALLFEGLVDARRETNGSATAFFWNGRGTDYRCRASVGAFGRVRVRAGTIEQRPKGGDWHPAELAHLVGDLPAAIADRNHLLTELQRTIEFCRWNDEHAPPASRRGMRFAELDGALDEGHPYHPCFKARTGFSESDHRLYGPEAGNGFHLVWLAVARRHLASSLPDSEDGFFRAQLGEETWRLLAAQRDALRLDPECFGFIPMHPWQWDYLRDDELKALIEAGDVHHLGAAGDVFRASQSVRTLFAHGGTKPSVKLAMNMSNTSALRTIEPLSVCAAPVLSRWLSGLVADDDLFDTRYPLALLSEYAGVIADPNGPLSGQIAAIWRENVEAQLAPGESAVPLNALMNIERDGRPFIEEWIQRHGLEAWTDRLIEIAIMPVWHLLVGHGIATEAHGQNMILVHREGWPVRLVLRDFHDSVEFVPDFLREPERAPDFAALNSAYRNAAPGQYYWMSSVDCLRELVVDCLFIYNFSEISHLLEESYGLAESDFWTRVTRRLELYASEHGLEQRQARLRHDSGEIFAESLLSRKLHPTAAEHRHTVPNMLAVRLQLREAS
jgi:siderophore synthetase component